jgi:hypothetical protein
MTTALTVLYLIVGTFFALHVLGFMLACLMGKKQEGLLCLVVGTYITLLGCMFSSVLWMGVDHLVAVDVCLGSFMVAVLLDLLPD